MSSEFFPIDLVMLKEETLFPFHLYVYNPASLRYSPFLKANLPFDEEKKELANYIIKNGGQICVGFAQKKTFLNYFSYDEKDIPTLNVKESPLIEKERLEHIHKINEKRKREGGVFHINRELEKSLESGNYMRFIEEARDILMCLPYSISPTVSLASFLAKELLTKDTYGNRVASIAVLLASSYESSTPEGLGDLFCAAMLYHIGLCQIDLSTLRTPTQLHDITQGRDYGKHINNSIKLIQKNGTEIGKRCKEIILDHHERADGRGRPSGKTQNNLSELTLTLGAVSHLIEFSEGKVNGQIYPLSTTIINFKNKVFIAGLELEFGKEAYSSIIGLIALDLNKQAA